MLHLAHMKQHLFTIVYMYLYRITKRETSNRGAVAQHTTTASIVARSIGSVPCFGIDIEINHADFRQDPHGQDYYT